MNDRPILWWYASGSQKFGPYTETQLRELAQSGDIQHGDLVWHHGLEDWVPATSIAGLLPATAVIRPPQLPEPEQDTGLSGGLPQHAPFRADGAHMPTMPTQRGATDAAAGSNAASDKALATFVGQNHDFYARQWAASERFGGLLSWNWAAFFLGPLWMAYRKMYWQCAVFCGLTLVVMTTLFPPQQQMTLQAAPDWRMAALELLIRLLMGMFGNWLYRQHAERKVQQITASTSDPGQRLLQLARQGGASYTSVLAVVAIVFLVSMLLTGIMLQLTGAKP